MNTQTLDKRKEKILQIIIEDYVSTGHPVGSGTICEKHHIDYSPATIRWEMLELEEDGFIVQTHTSSGRIPTDKGYRYYINNIMQSKSMSPREEEFIKNEFTKTDREIEHLLSQTSKIISAIVDYASIIVSTMWEKKLYYAGLSNMLRQQEFSDINSLMPVIEALEDELPIIESLNEAPMEEVIVKIGSENKIKEMRFCSIVMKSSKAGTIGIMGPTRMNYKKTTSVVDYVSNILDDIVGEVE